MLEMHPQTRHATYQCLTQYVGVICHFTPELQQAAASVKEAFQVQSLQTSLYNLPPAM